MQGEPLDPPSRASASRRCASRGGSSSSSASLYFFLPLIGDVRVLAPGACRSSSAYTAILADPKFFASLGYSFVVGFITIILSIAAHRPDRLLGPAARPARSTRRRVRDAAAVRHPADRARVRAHPHRTAARPLPFTHTDIGSTALLVCGVRRPVVPVHVPGGRHGPRAIDVQSLTEAAQSLGAGWLTDPVAGHPAEPARRAAERGVPDPRHRRRRVHDRELPGPHRRSGRTSRSSGDSEPVPAGRGRRSSASG